MQKSQVRRGIYIRIDNSPEVSRRDLIKALFEFGSVEYQVPVGNRSAIRDFINSDRVTPKQNIPFQIVYQATAGMESARAEVDTTVIDSIKAKATQRVANESKPKAINN